VKAYNARGHTWGGTPATTAIGAIAITAGRRPRTETAQKRKKAPPRGSPEWGFKFLGGWPKAWALSFIFRRRASQTMTGPASQGRDPLGARHGSDPRRTSVRVRMPSCTARRLRDCHRPTQVRRTLWDRCPSCIARSKVGPQLRGRLDRGCGGTRQIRSQEPEKRKAWSSLVPRAAQAWSC
jgi:hypothetical protein